MAASLGVSRLEQQFPIVGYSPESNDGSTEAEDSPLLEAVVRERLVKTQQTEKS
jgi:hypothetical protein